MESSAMEARRERDIRERREEVVNEIKDRLLSKIPLRYVAADEAPPTALAWIADPRDTLLLTGPKGTGKTHAAWSLYRTWVRDLSFEQLSREHPPIRFWSLPSFIDRLRPGNEEYTKPGPSWDGAQSSERIDHMVQAQTTRLLILDDVGAERLTDWSREQLFMLTDHRYNHMLPTAFTTNLPPSEFKQNVGDRISDRIAHGLTLVTMAGQSRRLPREGGE